MNVIRKITKPLGYALVFPFLELKHQLVTDKKFTSFDFGHRHSYDLKNKQTSYNGFHRHNINKKKMIAEPAGFMGHTHKL